MIRLNEHALLEEVKTNLRDSSRVILIQDGKIALIRRVKNEAEYYVVPGGGIEDGETAEQTAIREGKEELGLEVSIDRLIHIDEWHGVHHFFLVKSLSGVFGTGTGPEFYNHAEEKGIYEPVWMDLEKVHEIELRPSSILQKLRYI